MRLQTCISGVTYLLLRTLVSQVGSVALLPQELTGSEEGLGVLELPSHNGVPLVQAQRKVTVAANPARIVWVHHSLTCGTNGNLLLEGSGTGVCHPGDLSYTLCQSLNLCFEMHIWRTGETLNVGLLLVQHILGDEQGERAVAHAHLLNSRVEVLLDFFPDKVRGGLKGTWVSTMK